MLLKIDATQNALFYRSAIGKNETVTICQRDSRPAPVFTNKMTKLRIQWATNCAARMLSFLDAILYSDLATADRFGMFFLPLPFI